MLYANCKEWDLDPTSKGRTLLWGVYEFGFSSLNSWFLSCISPKLISIVPKLFTISFSVNCARLSELQCSIMTNQKRVSAKPAHEGSMVDFLKKNKGSMVDHYVLIAK